MTAFSRTARVLAAALAQMHPYLPGKQTNDLARFQSILQQANIERVFFLRHGQTGPSTTGKDFDRLLTPDGQEQSRTAGQQFANELKPLFSPVLVSSAPRVVETVQLFLEGSDLKESVDMKMVDALYDGSIQPKGSALFAKIGYAPLRDYLETEDESDREDARSVLGAYAHAAVDAIMEAASSASPTPEASTLCLAAHAVYLPAAVLGVSSLIGCEDTDVILSTNTLEAEGYLIDIPTSSVKYLARSNR